MFGTIKESLIPFKIQTCLLRALCNLNSGIFWWTGMWSLARLHPASVVSQSSVPSTTLFDCLWANTHVCWIFSWRTDGPHVHIHTSCNCLYTVYYCMHHAIWKILFLNNRKNCIVDFRFKVFVDLWHNSLLHLCLDKCIISWVMVFLCHFLMFYCVPSVGVSCIFRKIIFLVCLVRVFWNSPAFWAVR